MSPVSLVFSYYRNVRLISKIELEQNFHSIILDIHASANKHPPHLFSFQVTQYKQIFWFYGVLIIFGLTVFYVFSLMVNFSALHFFIHLAFGIRPNVPAHLNCFSTHRHWPATKVCWLWPTTRTPSVTRQVVGGWTWWQWPRCPILIGKETWRGSTGWGSHKNIWWLFIHLFIARLYGGWV